MFKQEKGITLVSLVITIIVMLILAGVSLSMVMGEGSVLNQATSAVDKTELSSVKDEIGMALGAAQTNYYAQYSNTTGRVSMSQCLLKLTKDEFTAADAVELYAPEITSGSEVQGKLVYYLANGNVYYTTLKITANSISQGEILKATSADDVAGITGVTATVLGNTSTVSTSKAALSGS